MKKVFTLIFVSAVFAVACATTSSTPDKDCVVTHEDVCYATKAPACEAAGCPDSCVITNHTPGRVHCVEE